MIHISNKGLKVISTRPRALIEWRVDGADGALRCHKIKNNASEITEIVGSMSKCIIEWTIESVTIVWRN